MSLLLPAACGCADLAGQVAERDRDGLVAVPRSVLVDERGPRAGVPQPDHQFLEGRAGGGGQGAVRMPQIMKCTPGTPALTQALALYPAEVGTPQPRLGADEDQALLPRLGEPLPVPARH
jgi:hypothetical protein